MWYKWQEGTNPLQLRSSPVNHQVLTKKGVGERQDAADELLNAFSEGLHKIYSNYTDPRSEESLLEWGTFPLSYRLTNGRTIIEDMMMRPIEGLNATLQMQEAWNREDMKAAVTASAKGNYWEAVSEDLALFADLARIQNEYLQYALKKLSGKPSPTPSPRPPAPPSPVSSFTKTSAHYWGTSSGGSRTTEVNGKSVDECAARCLQDAECFNFDYTSSKRECRTYHGKPSLTVSSDGYDAYARNFQHVFV